MITGIQSATRSSGNRNSGGITPITWRISPANSYARPMIAGSAPNQLRHSQSLMTTTPSSSSAVGTRPSAGWTPRVVKSDGVARVPNSRSIFSSARVVDWKSPYAPTSSSSVAFSRYSTYSSSGTPNSSGRLAPGAVPRIVTSRSACGNGSGRSSTASTTLKIAVVAPMASARVATVTSVKPGARDKLRAASARSLIQACSVALTSLLLARRRAFRSVHVGFRCSRSPCTSASVTVETTKGSARMRPWSRSRS
jgi:hypothetical protein